MDDRIEAGSKQQGSTTERAARVDLTDFAEALSTGIVRALERRSSAGPDTDNRWWPWIWAGWVIGPDGPTGPFGGGPIGGGPFDGGPEQPGR